MPLLADAEPKSRKGLTFVEPQEAGYEFCPSCNDPLEMCDDAERCPHAGGDLT
jgi:hypothetical protein